MKKRMEIKMTNELLNAGAIEGLERKISDNDRFGCSYGKINREKIDQLEKNQDRSFILIDKITMRLNITDVLLIILSLLTGGDIIVRGISFMGVLK